MMMSVQVSPQPQAKGTAATRASSGMRTKKKTVIRCVLLAPSGSSSGSGARRVAAGALSVTAVMSPSSCLDSRPCDPEGCTRAETAPATRTARLTYETVTYETVGLASGAFHRGRPAGPGDRTKPPVCAVEPGPGAGRKTSRGAGRGGGELVCDPRGRPARVGSRHRSAVLGTPGPVERVPGLPG